MALYIILNPTGDTKLEKQWYIGGVKPLNDFEITTISYIQADGDELEHIRVLFTHRFTADITHTHCTIPLPINKRIVKWYGDIAKTIIANL